MTLYDLFNAAIASDAFLNEGYDNMSSVLADLTDGSVTDASDIGYRYQARSIKFELQRPVEGQYVVFDSCPHIPSLTMTAFDHLSDVETHLTSDHSLLNAFTGFSAVFCEGTACPYQLWYRNTQHQRVLFIKAHQKGFEHRYSDPVIIWLASEPSS